MKSLIAVLALSLLDGVASGQPNQSSNSNTAARCNQVTQLKRLLQSAKMTVPPEIQTAGDACDAQMASLRSGQFDASRQLIRQAEAVLDQLNLTSQALFTRLAETVSAVDPMQRFYALVDLAKQAFDLGHPDEAQAYARELLQRASEHPKDWNYGNAIYYGYFVLGRLALQQGNMQLAGQYLISAGSTPGSPQLNSFGPNLTLAKELLEKGQGPVVLQFFSACKTFWKMDRGKLDEWSATIRGGGIPQITQNLNY